MEEGKQKTKVGRKLLHFPPTRLYKVSWSCRKAPPEFRFDPSGVAHPSQHLFLFLDSQHHPVRGFHIVSINIEIAAISRRIYFEIHFPCLLLARGTLSVSKNADSRHHVQYKFTLSCIIIKIKIAESR